jgi:hypothetical protein
MPLVQITGLATSGPLPTNQATQGFVFGLVGLLAALLPMFGVAFSVLGLMISANALTWCRRGLAGGRWRATAGVILPMLGLALLLFILLDFKTGSVRLVP